MVVTFDPSPEDKISIHALRVEGDGDAIGAVKERLDISIHALRVEGDLYTVVSRDITTVNFYPCLLYTSPSPRD